MLLLRSVFITHHVFFFSPGIFQVLIPMSKYAMTLTPIALSLEELMPSKELQSYSVSVIIRTILAISTLVVALTLPYFGEYILYLMLESL